MYDLYFCILKSRLPKVIELIKGASLKILCKLTEASTTHRETTVTTLGFSTKIHNARLNHVIVILLIRGY